MGNLRDTAQFLSTAVEATISALELQPEDDAAVQLARYYANSIDQLPVPSTMKELGPLLLATLAELGATPAARARISRTARNGGDPASAEPSRLDQLRESRAARRT